MVSSIEALHALGQSLWYDNIERRLLENGELAALIANRELRGVTSNPTIFEKAISKSKDYDEALYTLAWAGSSAIEIFDHLAVEDIQAAADLFRPLYEETQGADGYVSLEVNPNFANDTEATVAEAQRLWELVERPNLMVKIPATREGLPAITRSIAAGINVNVTLIFSLVRYAEVITAYLTGLEKRRAAGQPLDNVASVASFFVSRVDTKVDKRLQEIISQEGPQAGKAATLPGKAAVANARLAYAQFLEVFQGQPFSELKAIGARPQRPLWASTSTKNPDYSEVKYIEELIGPETVNTVPPGTLEAFRQQGQADISLPGNVDEARDVIQSLADLGIDMDEITQELEVEGVEAFAHSYNELIETIERRRIAALNQLGDLSELVASRVVQLANEKVPRRLHQVDPNLWTNDPQSQDEILERMGWLNLPESSRPLVPELETFTAEVREAGFERALLLGMGGSSLAPEVMSLVFAGKGQSPGLELAVLDSTDPAQVQAAGRWAAEAQTLFIVASKSGGTTEVRAFLHYFWAWVEQSEGASVGQSFIAITDPGTSLEQLARERGFRKIFLADPTVGGRNSALSAFGLVPASLLGIDLNRLLDSSARMAAQCGPEIPAARNPGLVLGAIMGEAARQGRDKLTLISDQQVLPFGSWLEQLIAESSGKDGKGIIPVEGEPLAQPDLYRDDRLFVYLRWDGAHDAAVEQRRHAGHPVLEFRFDDEYDLGAEFYRWEIATAVACAILGVNSFDQPDVQDSKNRTRAKIDEYKRAGKLDEGEASFEENGIQLYGTLPEGVHSWRNAIKIFLDQCQECDFVALNAYLPRNLRNLDLLTRLRVAIRERTLRATTVGFGPRFLHSTGQLHKGGPNTGLFLQITADPVEDMAIPGQGLKFGALQRAQALGDLEALLGRDRRVLRLHLSHPGALEMLVDKFIG